MITPYISTKVRRFAKQFRYSIVAYLVVSVCSMRAPAQDGHSHTMAQQNQETTTDQQSILLKRVREATARFKDVSEAERAHYALLFGCVSGPDEGAMGLHYVNLDLLDEVNKTGILDPARPQIVLYEAQPTGSLKLTGADFLVDADAGCQASRSYAATHGPDLPLL